MKAAFDSATAVCYKARSVVPSMTSSYLTRRHFLKRSIAASAGLLGAEIFWPRHSRAQSKSPPIEDVIFILRENHSYDNYFRTFPGGNGKTTRSRCPDEDSGTPWRAPTTCSTASTSRRDPRPPLLLKERA
jgi:phospholipase C